MFVSSNGNVFYPQNAVQQSFVYSFTKKRSIALCLMSHFFLYCNVTLFFMSCASAFLIKHSNVRHSRRKKQWKCRAWGQESAHIYVIAGVCFSHFFMRFARELALVRISGFP